MELVIIIFGLCIIFAIISMADAHIGMQLRQKLHKAGPYIFFLSIISLMALFTTPSMPDLSRSTWITILYTWSAAGILINTASATNSYMLREQGWWPKTTLVFSTLTGGIYFYLLIGGALFSAGIVD